MAQISPEVMVLVFFVYGLAWFLMGLTVALESRRASSLPLASSLKFLAAFGIVHGAMEWLDGWLVLWDPGAAAFSWNVVRTLTLATSTIILSYFGVTLIAANTARYRWLKRVPLGLSGLWLLATASSYLAPEGEWLRNADIMARYLLYLPGSILAGVAMVGQGAWFRRHGYLSEARDSLVVAGAFFFNSAVAGLIVPSGPFFPASVINHDSFYEWVRVPPQIFRGLAALVIAFFLVRVLNVFETERRRELEKAVQERTDAQEQSRSQLERWGRELEEKVRERTAEVEARNRELAILEERERIAREMHDSVGQTLGYMGLRLVSMEQHISAGQTDKAKKVVAELEQAVQSAMDDVKETILSLRSTRRPSRSLVATVQEVLTRFGQQTGLKTELKVEGAGEPPVTSLAQVQLLRVVQEALTNVRKHAQATRVTVTVRNQDQQTEIVVEDDGRGFEMDQVLQDWGSHFGLLTMRERAEEIGATFQIDSAPGHGTRVRIQLRRR